mgnify:CR=1 FL=1
MRKYYNVELSKKEADLLMDFLHKNNTTFENSYINSNYCHMEILLSPEEVTIVNNFLDTL